MQDEPLKPFPVKGLKKIAHVFATSDKEVRAWIAAGAPIVLIGRTYWCRPREVWNWLIEHRQELNAKRDQHDQ